jgi:hypothetical protein
LAAQPALTPRKHATGDAARPHARDTAMTRIVLPIAAAFTLSLSACATVPNANTGGPLPPSAMQCDASGASWAIGQSPTAEIVERIRVDTHSRIARVLRPGQVVTMEFSGERVSVNVNEREAIVGVTCG